MPSLYEKVNFVWKIGTVVETEFEYDLKLLSNLGTNEIRWLPVRRYSLIGSG